MRTWIVKLVVGLGLALGALGVVFVVGMRTKSPAVLDTVRRCGRASKRFVLPSAGTNGASVSVVRHVGRTTGRMFETPVQAVATDDGFVIALPYGRNTDWLKNVVAAGSAVIVHDGSSHQVERPEVVQMSAAARHFTSSDQRTHRLFRVDECLVVHSVPAEA